MNVRALGTILLVAAGLVLATPGDGLGQTATVQVRATVLAAEATPTVRVVGAMVDGEVRSSVLVTGVGRGAVRIRVAGEEIAVSGRRGESRGVLPVKLWTGVAEEEGQEIPIQVVVAAI